MATKTYNNKKTLISSSEHFLRQDIKRYEQYGWEMKGNIIQSTDGRYGCMMVRQHSFAGTPNNAG